MIFFPGLSGSCFAMGFSPSITQTASMTSLTVAGGDLKLSTSFMSAGLMVSSALIAEFKMGMASARIASQFSLIALASAALEGDTTDGKGRYGR